MTTRNKIFYDTASFYKDKSIPIHITLISKIWLNGLIKELESDKLVLIEERFGEMVVIFDRIKDDGIEPRKEKR